VAIRIHERHAFAIGFSAASSRLVAEHHAAVYRYAYRLAGSVPDAEDLCQQVFLVAQQKPAAVARRGAARSVAVRDPQESLPEDGPRSSELAAAGNAEIDINDIPTEIPSDDQIDREQLQEALRELSRRHRVVLANVLF